MATARFIGSDKIVEVRKIFCIGRNYAEHAKEMNASVPDAPIFFLKPATAIVGNNGVILKPAISNDLHHEVEMTVLIGRGGKHIQKSEALNHVAGYGIGLDMTLRDVQSEAKKKGLPWTLAKGFDTSAPLSSFVPSGQIQEPHNLGIRLNVNGVTKQSSNTKHFIFKIEDLISYISQFFTFERGDVIYTGTPDGVAQTGPGDRLEALLLSPADTVLASLNVEVQ